MDEKSIEGYINVIDPVLGSGDEVVFTHLRNYKYGMIELQSDGTSLTATMDIYNRTVTGRLLVNQLGSLSAAPFMRIVWNPIIGVFIFAGGTTTQIPWQTGFENLSLVFPSVTPTPDGQIFMLRAFN